tara:strand:- start:182 stop:586 length:405 start_codon:yes stop_codon:yes gene_type:complete
MGLNQSTNGKFTNPHEPGQSSIFFNVERWYYDDGNLKLVKKYDKLPTDDFQRSNLHCTTGPAVIEYNEDGQIEKCLYFLGGEEQFDVDPETFGKQPSWNYLDKLRDVNVDITQVASYVVLGVAAISISTQLMKK